MAEAAALAEAAKAAGRAVTFIVDNLGTVSRGRAILADVKGNTEYIPGLIRTTEMLEALGELGEEADGDEETRADDQRQTETPDHGIPRALVGPQGRERS